MTTDNVILAGLADQNEGEFKVVGEPFTEEPYGIGLAKDDTDFRMWINDVLEASYEDGTLRGGAGTRRPAPCSTVPEPPAVDRYSIGCPAPGAAPGPRSLTDIPHCREETPWTPSSRTCRPAPRGLQDAPCCCSSVGRRSRSCSARSSRRCASRRSPRCARSRPSTPSSLRNTPLTLVFFFLAFVPAARSGSRAADFVIGGVIGAHPLHVAVRRRGAAVRHQQRPGRAGRGGPQHRARLRADLALVILPQAFRMSIPPLINVFIALTKNTSVAGGFFVVELFASIRDSWPTTTATT